MYARLALVTLSLALVTGPGFAAEDGDEAKARARSIDRTGIPALCAERLPEGRSPARCIEHQLAAGRRIRKLLLANPGDGELEATAARCADGARASEASYDWVSLEDCIDAWIRSVRGRARGSFRPDSAG